MPAPTHPFDDLAPEVQAEVRATTAEVRAMAGDHVTRAGGTAHGGADRLALVLHDALTPTWPRASTTEQIRARIAAGEAALVQLEQFTLNARQSLETAVTLLRHLDDLVGADERRRAEAVLAEARRRELDDEVDRLAAGEDAAAEGERRARLEAEAKQRLGAGSR